MEEINNFDSVALVAITDSDGEENICQSKEIIIALMVGSDSEGNEVEMQFDVKFYYINVNPHHYSKQKLEFLSFVLNDAYYLVCAEKDTDVGILCIFEIRE